MPRPIITLKSGIIIRTGDRAEPDENVILDTSALTIEVTEEIDGRALYSAILDFFHVTPGMHVFPFPINPVDETSAKYQIGFDGRLYNGWQYLDLTSKKNVKSVGFTQYNLDSTPAQVWFGVTTPVGTIPDTAEPFYTFSPAANAAYSSFVFQGPVNEPILVFEDTIQSTADNRSYLKIFVKEWGKIYASADLTSVARSAMGGFSQSFGLSTSTDINITHTEAEVAAAPYSTSGLHWSNTPFTQVFTPGGAAKPFSAQFNNSVSSPLNRFQIYERVQYLCRQGSNINGLTTPAITGKLVRPDFAYFVGDTLFIHAKIVNLLPDDSNFVVFIDDNGDHNAFPAIASGQFIFNATIQAATGVAYTLIFANPSATVGDEWGTVGAIVVNDKDGNPIQGTLANGAASLPFSFDFGGNVQGGRTSGTNADCYLVLTDADGSSSSMKYLETLVTITSATGQRFLIDGAPNPAYVAA